MFLIAHSFLCFSFAFILFFTFVFVSVKFGCTPLMSAVENRFPEAVVLLLQYGADPCTQDKVMRSITFAAALSFSLCVCEFVNLFVYYALSLKVCVCVCSCTLYTCVLLYMCVSHCRHSSYSLPRSLLFLSFILSF